MVKNDTTSCDELEKQNIANGLLHKKVREKLFKSTKIMWVSQF